ncbi:MAG: threonine/serine exporter family protein [Propionibacteriaceae bacterium]
MNRRFRDRLRRETRDLWQGGPPTAELLRAVGDVPPDQHVFRVLDLCLLVGEVLLSSGEAAADTSATMVRLAGACGLETVEIDITFTAITMCCRRGKMVAPVTSMRLVRSRTTDLTRLASVTRIVDQVVAGTMTVQAADAAMTEAVSARHPYPRWLATAGWGGLAAAVALLLGGGPLIWVTAFVVTAIIDRIGRLLSRWDVPPFFLQIVGGFVATLLTIGLLAVKALPATTQPSLVIAACITALLSGLSLMGAVQDAISAHPVTAAGRAVEIALLSAGLLTGVTLGLKVGIWFDLSLDPGEPVAADVARFGISTVAAVAAAALSALAGYAPLRSLAAAGLAGGIGWAAFGALTLVQFGPVVATGLAAVVIGLASELFGRYTRIDRHVIVLSGIIPLLPGLTAYRGFYQLASAQDVVDGLVTIVLALAIGLALASGVTLGQFIARPRPAPAVGR